MLVLEIIGAILLLIVLIRIGALGLILDILFAVIGGSSGGGSSSGGFGGGDSGGSGSSGDY